MLLIMIILKNTDASKDVIHLIKIWHIYDEDPVVSAPYELEALAKKLDRAEDPTSPAMCSIIWYECRDHLEKLGYTDDKHRDRRNIIFAKSHPSCPEAKELVLPTECENLTTLDLVSVPASATVQGGRIVSAATAHFCDGIYEICTETAPSYRGMGYATDNVTALSDKLVLAGETVCYLCSEKNVSSVRVAEKSGFIEVGKSYDYTDSVLIF